MLFAERRKAERERPIGALGVGCALVVLVVCGHARAAEPCLAAAPWSRLGNSARNFARPVPLTQSALAVLAPFGFAPTGLDQQLRLVSQRDLFGKPKLEPVSVWTPYVLGGGLLVGYGLSAAFDSCSSKRFFSPLIQAGVVTFGSIGILKLGVGRRWPNGGTDPRVADRLDHPERAREFAPFQRGFAAWPSGHTALMFAGAAAFRASNPELGFASWLGYPLAVGVASGMWLGDHHWASDIVSGALLGEAIGSSVGQSFSEALGVPGALVLTPVDGTGFGATWFTLW